MFCSNCGKQIPDGSRSCPFCGASFDGAGRNNGRPQRMDPGRQYGASGQNRNRQSSYNRNVDRQYRTSSQGPRREYRPMGDEVNRSRRPKRRRGHGGLILVILLILAAAAVLCAVLFLRNRSNTSDTASTDAASSLTAAESAAAEVTVQDEKSAVTTLSQISESTLSSMREQAEQYYRDNISGSWGEGQTLQSMDCIGQYLLKARASGAGSTEAAADTGMSDGSTTDGSSNVFYLVYNISVEDQASNDDGDSYDQVDHIYWYAAWPGIVDNGDGTNTWDADAMMTPDNLFQIDSGVSDGVWGTTVWEYEGYGSLSDLYAAVVTDNASTYDHEDNVTDIESSDESSSAASADSESSSDEEGAAEEDGSSTDDSAGEETDADGADDGTAGDDADSGTEEDGQTAQSTDSSGLVLPQSSSQVLTSSDIDGLSRSEIQMAINEIYARNGYRFRNPDLLAHFEAYDWYHPTVAPDDFSEDSLSELDQENLKLLERRRDSMD